MRKCPIGTGMIGCQVCVRANGKPSAHLKSVFKMSTVCSNASSKTYVRPLCVKIALICKKTGCRLGLGSGIGLGSGLGLRLAFHRCTDKGHIFTHKG